MIIQGSYSPNVFVKFLDLTWLYFTQKLRLRPLVNITPGQESLKRDFDILLMYNHHLYTETYNSV